MENRLIFHHLESARGQAGSAETTKLGELVLGLEQQPEDFTQEKIRLYTELGKILDDYDFTDDELISVIDGASEDVRIRVAGKKGLSEKVMLELIKTPSSTVFEHLAGNNSITDEVQKALLQNKSVREEWVLVRLSLARNKSANVATLTNLQMRKRNMSC